jgi:hypothetical protein
MSPREPKNSQQHGRDHERRACEAIAGASGKEGAVEARQVSTLRCNSLLRGATVGNVLPLFLGYHLEKILFQFGKNRSPSSRRTLGVLAVFAGALIIPER